MKRFLLFLVAIIVFSSSMLVLAYAEDEKVYEIDSVVFDVALHEDGSADITETWDVNYISGEFSRFRKEIYTNVPSIESFSKITNFSAAIDGEELIFSESDGYTVKQQDDRVIISAHRKCENERHIYTFSYTLVDVVKRWDDYTSRFSYRFVGQNHSTNIKDIYVNISTPFYATFQAKTLNNHVYDVQDSSISYHSQNSVGLYKITLDIHGFQVFGTPQKSSFNLKDAISVLQENLIYIFVGISIPASIYYGIRNKILWERKELAMLEYDLTHQDLIDGLIKQLGDSLSHCQIASLCLKSGGSVKIITVALAELIQSGHISLTENMDGMFVNPDMPEPQLTYQKELLQLVNDAYTYYHKQHETLSTSANALSFDDFKNFITYCDIDSVFPVRKQLESIRNSLSEESILNGHPDEALLRGLTNRLLPILRAQNFSHTPFSELLNDIQKFGKLELFSVVAYMLCDFSTDQTEPLDIALSHMFNNVSWKSSSASYLADSIKTISSGNHAGNHAGCTSCTSCTSCSSCSSCGGCGAD